MRVLLAQTGVNGGHLDVYLQEQIKAGRKCKGEKQRNTKARFIMSGNGVKVVNPFLFFFLSSLIATREQMSELPICSTDSSRPQVAD